MSSDDSAPGTGETAVAMRQVVDRQHNGVVAWVYEAPADWHARGEVVWNYQYMSYPVTSFAQTFAPNGPERFEFLPAEAFCWLEPHYDMYQQGQMLMGQVFMAPMSAADALVRWVVPKYRGNLQGLRVTGVAPLAGLVEGIGLDLKGLPSETVAARIEYVEGGIAIEEEIIGVLVSQVVPYHGPMGTTIQTNWGFARLFASRAERGRLDATKRTFWSIMRSARINPEWERLCAHVMGQIQVQFDQYIRAGYSQIQAAGQLSRAISANNDAMLNAFEQQRQAASHTHRSSSASDSSPSGFDEYIRGVETVDDPYYGESQQDYTYRYHWTDGSGQYRHSNDPFFNPNQGSSVDWTLMEPKKK